MILGSDKIYNQSSIRNLNLMNFIFKIFLTLILILFSSAFCYPHFKPEFTLTYSKFVRVSDSTRIKIHFENNLSNDYQFRWQANYGIIESSGREVIYKSPDSVCTAAVDLEIFYKTDFISKHTFNISIFKQLIILKADDLIYDGTSIIPQKWINFFHYVVSEKLKTSAGLICNSLETKDERYFGLLNYLHKTGFVELWNHGYDHLLGAKHPTGEEYDEFRNSSLEYQKQQLQKGQNLAREKLNISLRTFGAPGNAIDNNTILALKEFDEIKVWFFGLEGSGKLLLGRSADMEYPVGNPDYDKFVNSHKTNNEYVVFQIHPNMWDETQFNTFKRIISYLRERNSTFLLPYEYYERIVEVKLN